MLTLSTLTILSETAGESSLWDVDHLLVLSNVLVVLVSALLTYYTRRASLAERKDDNRTLLAVIRAFLGRGHKGHDSTTDTESF